MCYDDFLISMLCSQERSTQLEAEVLRLSEQLKGESTAVLALKRQLTQFSDIAERYQSTIKDGNIVEGMEEVLEKIGPLFSGQANVSVSPSPCKQ
jgi:hypothetical protein